MRSFASFFRAMRLGRWEWIEDMRRLSWVSAALAGALVIVGVGAFAWSDDEYELKVLMPSASGTYAGATVMMDGQPVGQITDVGVQEDKALVTAAVDAAHAPLPAGTTARISWKSVIGARVLELLPGPEKNPSLPSGKMIVSKIERVEIDDVLATLDGPTRERVQSLVKRMNHTLDGREQDINATLKTAGPAVDALGEVMRAVGEDGPAIRDLVTRLHGMTSELAERDTELGQTVQNLGQLTSATADKQQSLKAALTELAPTVRSATATLDDVPRAVDATAPLLRDLRPATEQLPRVAGNLSPVMAELRPTVAELKPTLASAQRLLQYTPDLLDNAHATLPGTNEAVTSLQPAVAFLRPYTPETMGWISNWAHVFGSQNSGGNYARALVTASATSFNDNPGVLPPGFKQDPRPAPGSIVGQPWTDANGDGIR